MKFFKLIYNTRKAGVEIGGEEGVDFDLEYKNISSSRVELILIKVKK